MDEGFVNTCSELEDHHHCHDGPRSHSSRAVKQSLHEIEEGNKNKCNSHLYRMHKSLWVVCNKSPGVRLEEWSTERTEDTDDFIKHSIMQAFGSRRTDSTTCYNRWQWDIIFIFLILLLWRHLTTCQLKSRYQIPKFTSSSVHQ